MNRLPTTALILFLISFSITISQAQVSKGRWMLGGSAYINPDKYFSIQIRPTANYMISNKFAIGAIMNFGYANFEHEYSISSYFVPTARYYLGKSRTQPFLLAGFGFSQFSNIYKESNPDDYKYTKFSFYWGAGVGLSHFVNDNIALEAIAGYSNSSITIYRGLFFNLGFQVFLNQRKNEE